MNRAHIKHYKLKDIFNAQEDPGASPVHCITQKIIAQCRDMADQAMVEACVECAKAEGFTDLYLLDRRFVTEALKEKMEREKPEPLTLDELRQMYSVPVYIDDWLEDFHGWELSEDARDYFEGRDIRQYGSAWVAYRINPEEVKR